jgi:hypothetical protein
MSGRTLLLDSGGLILRHCPKMQNSFLRPLKKKGFQEENATQVGWDDISEPTTLESNQSDQSL